MDFSCFLTSCTCTDPLTSSKHTYPTYLHPVFIHYAHRQVDPHRKIKINQDSSSSVFTELNIHPCQLSLNQKEFSCNPWLLRPCSSSSFSSLSSLRSLHPTPTASRRGVESTGRVTPLRKRSSRVFASSSRTPPMWRPTTQRGIPAILSH